MPRDGDAARTGRLRRCSMPPICGPARGKVPMNGKYVGYVAGEDPLHGFLSMIMRDRLDVREPRPAFRVFRLSGSNEVYAYEEKFSRVKIICKFYGTRFAPDSTRRTGRRARSTSASRRCAGTTWSDRRTT